MPQRPNSFCVPEDDDDAVDVVHETAPVEGPPVATSPVDDLDIGWGEESQPPAVSTPISQPSNNGTASAEHISVEDDQNGSQDSRHAPGLVSHSHQSPIVLGSEEPPRIAPAVILATREWSDSEDYANSDYGSDDTDSEPGSVSSEPDMTGECDVWVTNEEPIRFEEDLSQCPFSEGEPDKASGSKGLSRASVSENHKPLALETERTTSRLLDTRPLEQTRKQEDTKQNVVSSTANKDEAPVLEETGYDMPSEGPQNNFAEGPALFDPLDLYWSPIPKRNTPPPPAFGQDERACDRAFPRYEHFGHEFEKMPPGTSSIQGYPLRDSSQHDPCLLQANSYTPYQDGPFMPSQLIAQSGNACPAPNVADFTYFDNLDVEDRLDGQRYQQTRKPGNPLGQSPSMQGNSKLDQSPNRAKMSDASSGRRDEQVLSKPDEIKRHSSMQQESGATSAGNVTASKGPLKRKASEMEPEPLASDTDAADPLSLEQDTLASFSLGAVNASQKSFSQDAQPRVSSRGAERSASQLTDLHPIEEYRSIQPPRKRVNTGRKRGAGSFATHATTAIVGAMLGGLGTIVALASLPPGYFH